MPSINDLTIDAFLPLAHMREVSETAHSTYSNAKPFPHIVFDNFFDPALLNQILEEFPKPGAIRWQKFDNAQEIKLAS